MDSDFDRFSKTKKNKNQSQYFLRSKMLGIIFVSADSKLITDC